MFSNRAALLSLLILLASPIAAKAQMLTTGAGTTSSAPPPAYVGPGNVVSGARIWVGLRAYNAAYAVAHSAILTVRRGSDSTTQTINALSTGAVDIASAVSFGGTDATGTGSISGTTLTFTGGHIGDTVSGGTTLPATVIVSGSSPTWTVNRSQTVGSTTLTLAWGLFITTLNDQTGNGFNMTQVTTTKQPLLVPNAIGSLPGIVCLKGNATNLGSSSISNSSTVAATFSWVAMRVAAFTTQQELFGTAGNGGVFDDWAASANTFFMFAGTVQNVTASDNAFHAEQSIYNNTLSFASTDGVRTPVGTFTTGNTLIGGTAEICANVASVPADAVILEAGIWQDLNFNSTQISAMNANQHAYWGF